MLYDHQSRLKNDIYAKLQAGKQNILGVLPCGGGKTVIMVDIFNDADRESLAIAHRQELVSQMSMTIARAGKYHSVVAPNDVIRFIIAQQIQKFGRNYITHDANLRVAGVDTINRRGLDRAEQIKLWQLDEAHHLIQGNKWHKAISLLKNCWGIGWTATDDRADGRGLGRDSDGIFDALVQGPTMRELIAMGYLCDYVIYGPPESIDRKNISISSTTHEFNPNSMRAEARRSPIIGDVVAHYLRYAAGKLGITFAVDVGLAEQHAAAFNYHQIPAAVITAKTPAHIRSDLIDRFSRREILQLVNVDIFGEGFDLPILDVVSMARPTESRPLYEQQFCRPLRISDGKSVGIIIDHVGNVHRHGLPDKAKIHSLDARSKRHAGPVTTPTRTCLQCFRIFEGWTQACPYCGAKPPPIEVSAPELVDGDLECYSPELLARLRGEADRAVAMPNIRPQSAKDVVIARNMERRAEVQHALRETLALWGGVRQQVYGENNNIAWRRFYRTFGVDVATAKTFGTPDASKLRQLVLEDLGL